MLEICMKNLDKFSFGLNMIVIDSTHLLPRILDNIDGIFDEVIIVDTGSQDGTVELIKTYIAEYKRSYGSSGISVQLYHYEWDNNFANARNFALSKINSPIVMWLDSDDTFTPEVGGRWRELARDLYNNPNFSHFILPYYYAVDENDNPLLLQYRERILKNIPGLWEWREPIHEVCCQVDGHAESKPGDLIKEAPVIHKPARSFYHVNDRNWKILVNQNLVNDDNSVRTLYYLQRETLERGQPEFSIQIGKKLREHNPSGYYGYECLKGLGDSYHNIYMRDREEEYSKNAISYYEEAIKSWPERNEAIDALVSHLLLSNQTMKALEVANWLNEEMPMSTATLVTDKYGNYKYSVLASIQFNYCDLPAQALDNHIKALDSEAIPPIALQNDVNIRNYMDMNNIGIIYADQDLIEKASWLKEVLLEQNVFKHVFISTNPQSLGFSRYWHFHITSDPTTIYAEDSYPKLRKFLVCNTEERFLNWEVFSMPETKEDCKAIIDEITSPVEVIAGSNLENAFISLKNSHRDKGCILFSTFSEEQIDYIFGKDLLNNKIRLVVKNKDDEPTKLLAVYGNKETLISIGAVDNRFICQSLDQFDIIEFNDHEGGVEFEIELHELANGTVAIYAGGIEEWDGTTPYSTGIGASESSVIYLAEELVRNDYKVVVYCPVSTPRKVGNVFYTPISHFSNKGKFDVFISSRVTSVLKGQRHGKKQYLWMHDIPQAYGDVFENLEYVVDKFICVSNWQFREAVKLGCQEHRLEVIPNGIYKNPSYTSERFTHRTVWISQPERGLDNIYKMYQQAPELFKDLWVLYGFYNYRHYKPNDFGNFKTICRWKHLLRKMNAKITGRIPIQNVRELLSTCEKWVYPSEFPETQCVAGMEVANAGVKCFVNNNGATIETLKYSLGNHFNNCVCVPTGKTKVENSHIPTWIEKIRDRKQYDTRTGVLTSMQWPRLAERWVKMWS